MENPSPFDRRLEQEEKPKRIALLAYDNAKSIDITGPIDVFAMADRLMRQSGKATEPFYSIEILAEQPGPITTMGGVRIIADRAYQTLAMSSTPCWFQAGSMP